MRKITLLSILLALTTVLFAKHVPMETAKYVAKTFWEQNVLKGNSPKLTNAFYDISDQTDFSNLYIFNTDNGFVIVSADDAAKPILGYSQQGSFAPNNIPVNAREWLNEYNSEIKFAIDNNIEAGAETQEAWNKLRNGIGLAPKSARSVSQLLTTTWNQSPYYNDLCPYDYEEDCRSVTGCAATALAQLMKYWNWPTHGYGSHSYIPANHPEYGILSADFGNTTYDWDNMPNALTPESSSTEINAVATLMYHCGVSMEMNYGPHGSGAYAISYYGQLEYSAENALRDFFGYSPDLNGQYRSFRYLDGDDTLTYEVFPYDEWMSMLIDELDANRPIYYGGQGPDGGHGFIFDGYDNNEFFHVNWGWAGYADGYFTIDALEPAPGGIGGGSYQFNYDQTAIFGVEPASTHYTVNVLSISSAMGSVSGSGTYSAGQQITISATANNGYRFTQWNDGNTDNPRTITVTEDATYTAMFASVTNIQSNIDEGIDIFPNPTNGTINITSQEKISEIEILNTLGQIAMLMKVDSDNATCNISDLPNGVYFIKIYSSGTNDISVKKLTKE